MTDAAALDALAAKQVVPGYIGFDATAPSLHVGSLVQIMMLRRLQQAGHKPIVLMGGGTTQGRRSVAARTKAASCSRDETIDANIASIRTRLRALPDLRRRADRRDHGQQCRLARRARLHPVPARRRAAFHDQPDADLRQRQAAARPRAAADLPRIQLHDPAGLRFPRAVAPRRLPAADGRLGPVGQYRQRHRAGAADRRHRAVRRDHAR